MKQKLSPMAFLELFTDDDMDVITMRKLLRNTAARREKVYRVHGQVLEAAARQVGCLCDQTSRRPRRGETCICDAFMPPTLLTRSS
jgi:hypothetical protein